MTQPPSIDAGALDRLREWGGDKLVGQMIRLFLENSPARMDQIRKGAGDGDSDEAEKGAHSLKSSAANVGAEKVRELAAQMERLAISGDMDGYRALVPRLEAEYGGAIVELESIEKGIEA